MKRLSAVLLSIIMIVSMCVSAGAAVLPISETSEKVVITDSNWAYEKINLYGWELDEYIGTAAEVELPWSFAKEYVTAVGDYAFSDNTTVTSVTTTGVLETIDNYAFNGCTSLVSITLYDALTTLGVGSFYGDTSLTNINMEDTSITAVSAYCFAECGISELALPSTCTSIGNMAFYNCGNLSKLVIPNSVTEIEENAFLGCENIVIYAMSDSYAITFAQENDIDYVITDPQAVNYIVGDADGDGEVTILDSTKIQRVLAELDTDVDGMITLRGHTYGEDNELNIMDATSIQRYLADYIVDVPFGEEATAMIPVI